MFTLPVSMTRQQIPPNHKKPGDREEVNRTGVLTRTAYERFVIGGELLFGQHIPRHCRSLVAPTHGLWWGEDSNCGESKFQITFPSSSNLFHSQYEPQRLRRGDIKTKKMQGKSINGTSSLCCYISFSSNLAFLFDYWHNRDYSHVQRILSQK